MATWLVTVPIAGSATIEVEASSEKEAIDAALNSVGSEHLDEWEACWEAEAILIDGEPDGEDE